MSIHSQLTGDDLHEPYHYVQEADPGAVGSGKYWLQLSTALIKRRNDANSAWIEIGGANSPLTTKGDIWSYSTQNTRLAVGTNGQVLTADSTAITGLKWETPSGGGGSIPDWVTFSPLNPPGSANAMDDEFATADTLPGGASPLWTWLNQGVATVGVSNNKLTISLPGVNALNVRGLYQTLPAAPWEFTSRATINGPFSNYQIVGLFLQESGTTEVKSYGLGYTTGLIIRVDNWNSPTSFNAQPHSSIAASTEVFFKLADDNTNFIFSTSIDGVNWIPRFTEARNTFCTPNRIGILCYFESATGTHYSTVDFFRRTV